MKKLFPLIIALLFIALCINVFGETSPNYPFDVKISGKGKQSIILIPGFASSGEVWKETTAKYERDFTCYTLTMAGFAGTKAESNPTFKNWESGIARYITEQKITKPIIIGHSMGGGLALAIASDYPELISKIVVVDALPCLASLMNPSFKSKENNECKEMIDKITSMNNEEFYQMQKKSILQLLEDTSKQELAVSWSVKSDRKTFAEMYCDFSNTDLREKITTVKCPSLIMLESYFKNFEPAIKDQYKNLKTADLQFADKGLHFIMYDDFEWYIKQLDKFLSVN